jgi:cytochrome o ubiquinol oxidase subunit 1
MPRNTAAGVILSGLAFIFGFAMIWYIWWLAALSLIGLFVVGIGHTFNYNRDYFIQPDEVARIEGARSEVLGRATGA